MHQTYIRVWIVFAVYHDHIVFHFCQKISGQVETPAAHSGRFVIAFWWLFVVVTIVATYMGNLIAFLTVIIITPPFTNIEELAAQKEYKYGTMGDSAWEVVFRVNRFFIHFGVIMLSHEKILGIIQLIFLLIVQFNVY